MFNFEGIESVTTVHWDNLKPGMILIGGFTVNDTIPFELRNFPVLTHELLNCLHSKYFFLKKRTFTVAIPLPGWDSSELSHHILYSLERFKKYTSFTTSYVHEKKEVLRNLGLDEDIDVLVVGSDYVEKDHLILDTYNSFIAPVKSIEPEELSDDIPTFIDPAMEMKMTLNDLLSGRVSQKFNLPNDTDVALHLVVDYSYSMNQMDKLDIVLSSLNTFSNFISEFFLNTKLHVYVFSDKALKVNYPLTGREIEKKGTSYGSFMKKVLNNRDPDRYNKVILFTDGKPSDLSDALLNGERMKKMKIDYTQIVFSMEGEDYFYTSGDESDSLDGYYTGESKEQIALSEKDYNDMKEKTFETYSKVARMCGGNQVILTINELARFVSVECYDRYMGMLTLATKNETDQMLNKPYDKEVHKSGGVNKFEFKKLIL